MSFFSSLLVADNDTAGHQYVDSARNQLGERAEQEHISQLPHGDLELYLCVEGYGHVYERYVAPNKRIEVTATPDTHAYWEQVTGAQMKKTKILAVVEVIEEIRKRGATGVPQQLASVLNGAISLAKEAKDA